MPRHWVRVENSFTASTAQSFAVNQTIYRNQRAQVSSAIQIAQKATVVATHLWGITDNEDTWSMTLVVVDESRTPTYSDPNIASSGGSDQEVKGWYPFARGPVLYSPRRLISIPVESDFIVRVNKELGGNSSTIHYHLQFLIQTSLA